MIFLELSEEAQDKIKEIQALENKYGYIIFRMGFSHLMDAGHSNFDDASVEKGFELILAEEEAEKASGKRSFVTAECKRKILSCSAELAGFSILTLFAYIKEHFIIDI